MIEENGILIIRLKFFRFLNNNNNSLSEKQIEILRTFSFINVEDELELLDIDEKSKRKVLRYRSKLAKKWGII